MWKAVALNLRSFLCEVHGASCDHNYAPDPRLLDPQISAKITEQELVNALWKLIVELQTIVSAAGAVPQHVRQWYEDYYPCRDVGLQTQESILLNDSRLVQVTASKSEIDRRIEAFMRKKRLEMDAYNAREFCTIPESEESSTCARTDAAFVPRQSKKSILKISSVMNRMDSQESKRGFWQHSHSKTLAALHPSALLPCCRLPSDIKERVSNLESHLSVSSSGYEDVYAQIKHLEGRILHLETLSPEYFALGSRLLKKGPVSTIYDGEVRGPSSSSQDFKGANKISFIDLRIAELKDKLLGKAEQ